MADQRDGGISWTEETWNPIVGCSIVSPACTNCYAMSVAAMIERASGGRTHYAGTTKIVNDKPVWTGKLVMAPEHIVTNPLRWKRPRRVFVNSMSDLFHEDMPEAWIDRVFAIMALAPQHTFQVLTKRPERMRAYVSAPATVQRVYAMVCDIALARKLDWTVGGLREHDAHAPPGERGFFDAWPLSNVWLGVTAEDQTRADERVPLLLATPAAIRFVSAEPLLGSIDFNWIDIEAPLRHLKGSTSEPTLAPDDEPGRGLSDPGTRLPLLGPFSEANLDFASPGLDWIIVGGESGPGARPTHPDWVRSIRDQCAAAGVAFHFKQWGDLEPDEIGPEDPRSIGVPPGHVEFRRVGKKAAGRKLDGVIHDAFPMVRG